MSSCGYGSFFFRRAGRPCCGRSRLSLTLTFVVDPLSFIIGGLGAIAIRTVIEEINREGGRENSNWTIITNSGQRLYESPTGKTTLRFIKGGCFYLAFDNITINMFGISSPLLSGSVTGLYLALGARMSDVPGSVLAMTTFSLLIDRMLDGLFSFSKCEDG